MVKYFTKAAGVTFEGRQQVIGMMNSTMPIRLRREKDNKHDPNAVAIDVELSFEDPNEGWKEEWKPFGFLAKNKNKDIARMLDEGKDVKVAIGSITGGGDKNYGVNISVEYEEEAKPKVVGYKIDKTVHPNTEMYYSRVLGDSIEVVVNNGHKSLPGFMSGSKFPSQFYREFDSEAELNRIVEKHYPKSNDEKKAQIKLAIADMWETKGQASRHFGHAIHSAMEVFIRYHKLGDKTKTVKSFKTKPDEYGPNKALSSNPFIQNIVHRWASEYLDECTLIPEEFIWDVEEMLCGSVDLIKVIDADKKIIRIQDFKTDGDIHCKEYQLSTSPFYKLTQGAKPAMGKELLDYHWLQLSFYAYILSKKGYTIEGLDIYWLNPHSILDGEKYWEKYSHDVIDIKEGL